MLVMPLSLRLALHTPTPLPAHTHTLTQPPASVPRRPRTTCGTSMSWCWDPHSLPTRVSLSLLACSTVCSLPLPVMHSLAVTLVTTRVWVCLRVCAQLQAREHEHKQPLPFPFSLSCSLPTHTHTHPLQRDTTHMLMSQCRAHAHAREQRRHAREHTLFHSHTRRRCV